MNDRERDPATPEPADAESGSPEAAGGTPGSVPAESAAIEGSSDSAPPAPPGEPIPAEPAAESPDPPPIEAAAESAAPPAETAAGPAGPPRAAETAESPAAEPDAAPPPLAPWAERAEETIEVPRGRLAASSRRDFLLFAAGAAIAAAGAFWLLPDGARRRWLGVSPNDPLDRLAARIGLSREARERGLNRALTFDDDVAEALYSKDRRVRTYSIRDVTPLRNNWAGATPTAESLRGWRLSVAGLASGAPLQLDIPDLIARFTLHGQVTRFVCVEGWSAVAWFGGVRFADFLEAFPPAPGARWAALRSDVSLDRRGRPDPYYVSIDLDTARHPQTLLATHFAGRPLTPGHGAPLRLRAPMKLGLKNIKAITHITYVADEPRDYWAERGYSRYDGL